MTRKKQPQNRRQAVGAILLVLGLLLALSFLPKASGLPVLLGRAQRVALGDAAWLIPIYVFALGAALVLADEIRRFARRVAAVLLVTASGLAAYHARAPLGREIAVGIAGGGTGVGGGAVLWALRRAFGEVGVWVVILLCAVTGGILWTGIPFATIVHAVWEAVVEFARLVARGSVALWQILLAGGRAAGRVLLKGASNAVSVVGQLLRQVAARLPRSIPEMPTVTVPSIQPAGPPPSPSGGQATAADTGSDYHAPASALSRVEGLPRPQTAAGARQESLALEIPQGGYQLPPLSLLTDLPASRNRAKADPAEVAKALEQTLASFGVEAKVTRWEQGPVVTRFEVQPAPGVRIQKISSLTNDIALALAASSVRIEAPIPGKSAVGIELPNQKTSLVHIKEILNSEEYQRTPGPLTVALGKDIAGHPILADLSEMPHVLIAGATGSGKSVMLNAIIAGLLFRCTPLDVRLLMIDPKRVEFTHFNNVPHLLVPVVTNPRATSGALKEMLQEMEERFERFASTGTRNIQAYNELPDVDRLPYIVIVIDELADLMMVAPADFEDVICRLAQMTRATGIHMVLATQRPSVDVITGLIKANIPSRIAFAVTSQVDSRTILDMPGAEKLLGRGDMLFMPISATRPTRAQGAFIADSEIQTLVAWWKAQGKPVYDQDLLHAEKIGDAGQGDEDELLVEAARLIVRAGYGSVSLLQRKMKIGYVRAARIVDQLEERGIVGLAQGSNPREVLVGLSELDALLKSK